MKKTNKRGFTLIELMIVVAIIGILAAVAIPAFINYMKRAKTSEATLNLKSIAEGAVSYHDTHGNKIPSEETQTPSDTTYPRAEPIEITAAIDAEFNSEGWQQIGWKPHKAFLYVYQFDRDARADTTASGTVAEAIANGDLDGDGTDSTFIRPLTRISGGLVKPDDLLDPTNELE